MNVSSIQSAQSFGNANLDSGLIRSFVNLSDQQVADIAYNKAGVEINDKRHKRVNNALFATAITGFALSSTVKEGAALGFKNLSQYAKSFGKNALIMGLPLLAFDLVLGGFRALSKKKDKPANGFALGTAIVAMLGSSYAALTYLPKGLSNLKAAMFKSENKFVKPAVDFMKKSVKYVDSSKVVNVAKKGLSHVPQSVRLAAAKAFPWIASGAMIAHLFKHQAVKNQVAGQIYNEIKLSQELLKEDLDKGEV